MPGRRRAALLCLGLVLAAMVVTPAGAHVSTNVNHLWAKHLKPLATKVFYTKAQSNARYYTKTVADNRYYTKAASDGRYYSVAAADLRFALKGAASESDFSVYCAQARLDPRSFPAELCDASLVVALDSAGSVGEYTSLAVGADGLPVVAYRDGTNGDFKILHCGNAACTAGNLATSVDAGASNVGGDASLAVGADGLPVASYHDVTNGQLKILHCGNLTCTAGNQLTPADTGAVGSDTSLAIGTDGKPLVSYLSAVGELRILHCGDAACSAGNLVTPIEIAPAGVGSDTSLAVGADGLPVASYYDADDGDLRILHCGSADCATGNQMSSVETTGWVGDFSAVAVGLDGLPVVSFRDGTNGSLRVLHCGDVACVAGNVTTEVDTTADPLGYDTSIAIGRNGFPVVSYYDGANSDLRFLTCGNADCSSGNESIAVDSAGNVGRHTSVAIGLDGLPLVTYQDESNGDLKLARPPVPSSS